MDQSLLRNVEGNLSQVVDLLYQENIKMAYKILAVTLPTLEQLLIQITDEALQKELIEKLQSALEAMEEQDNTLLADIITYELLEQLQKLED